MSDEAEGERSLGIPPVANGGYQEYPWEPAPEHSHRYLLPAIRSLCPPLNANTRVLDVGCGNGTMAAHFIRLGCRVVGIDLSGSGIELARQLCPSGRFEVLAADHRVLEELGEDPFDLVISTEVVEHLYDPKAFARGCFAATKSGGTFVCTTPYHGYLKNLAIDLAGGWDRHHDPLWDGGHIKFWSWTTLSKLLEDTGFADLKFRGAGRLPGFWKSMVVSGRRP